MFSSHSYPTGMVVLLMSLVLFLSQGSLISREEGKMRVSEEQTLPYQAEDSRLWQSHGLERWLRLKRGALDSNLLWWSFIFHVVLHWTCDHCIWEPRWSGWSFILQTIMKWEMDNLHALNERTDWKYFLFHVVFHNAD